MGELKTKPLGDCSIMYTNSKLDGFWPDVDSILSPDLLDCIVASSPTSDEMGEIQDETIDLLKSANYFGLAVPKEFEGGGYGLVHCCAVQRRIGSIDPGLAIALNMHLFSIGVVREHWSICRDLSWALLEAIATQNKVVASAFAEPRLAGNILRSNCQAYRVDGGYIVSGRKSPCSLVRRCDLVCLQFEVDNELLIVLIPSHAQGLKVELTWDSMGMRSSESDSLVLENCFIPEDLVFHRTVPGFDASPVFNAGLCWFSLTTTATYLGIVRAVLEIVCHQLKKSHLPSTKATRADISAFQFVLGDIVAEFLTLESACLNTASLMDSVDREFQQLLPRALALKHAAIEQCTKSVTLAIELCGASAYQRNSPLARFWRDVQAIHFHPPTRFTSRQILGRWMLDLPYSFEL